MVVWSFDLLPMDRRVGVSGDAWTALNRCACVLKGENGWTLAAANMFCAVGAGPRGRRGERKAAGNEGHRRRRLGGAPISYVSWKSQFVASYDGYRDGVGTRALVGSANA